MRLTIMEPFRRRQPTTSTTNEASPQCRDRGCASSFWREPRGGVEKADRIGPCAGRRELTRARNTQPDPLSRVRYTQEDPLQGEASSEYAYVDAQPVLFADAFGLVKRRPLPTPTPIPTPTPTPGPTPTPTPAPIPIQRRPPSTFQGPFNPCPRPWRMAFWDQFPANPYRNRDSWRDWSAAFDLVCLASAPRGHALPWPVVSSSPSSSETVGYSVCCHDCDPSSTPTPGR